TRALLEGMAEVFYEYYKMMLPFTGARRQLVGSGNGICLNRLFQRILAERFGLPLVLPAVEEAAATGAALVAAVGTGEFESWSAASRWIRYA
ncbi:MAG: autoinducer-2 kinase, partial [Chloroflexi bacterium]|nr:autoinducer-2 kinase [Chloroflexota bacterium]